ncbi:MAG TPA: tRNA dihydrouridine synthase DusB [Bacteroidales bacterium]|nr:tRNA dihydrouridine synthase DusB [Bacteroidales bacterium]
MKIAHVDLGEKPLLLAPLEDVTDSAFRLLCRKFGADMVVTEFISSEGLIREAEKSHHKLLFNEAERPIAIQIFGHDPESMRQATIMAESANPDFIDINFGCPVRKVTMKGGGADLLRDVPRMVAITKSVAGATRLPVTVKTRLGWDEGSKNIVDIAERLQDCGIVAITIHGRTRAQLYKGLADWTLIGEVKNNPAMHIPVIGNGDVDSPEKAKKMFDTYGVDAVMIGRAAIGNPWLFGHIKNYLNTGINVPLPGLEERVRVCREHLYNAVKLKGERRAILEMRKHYSGYFRAIPYFKKVRLKILTCNNLEELDSIFERILHTARP